MPPNRSLPFLSLLLLVSGCGGGEGPGDTGPEADTDTDVDTDADVDTGTDTDTGTAYEAVTLHDLQSGAVEPETLVSLGGVVVVGDHASYGFHVWDPAGGETFNGLWIYYPSGALATDTGRDPVGAVSEGDAVTVTGQYLEYDPSDGEATGGDGDTTLTEIHAYERGEVTIEGTGELPVPTVLETDTWQDDDALEPYEGMLIQVEEVTVSEGGEGEFVLEGDLAVDDMYYAWPTAVSEQDTFTAIAGLLYQAEGGFVLEPRNADDFGEHGTH